MKQKNEQDALLKKARRAVWLNRHLGITVPKEYEMLIIKKECCDEQFMCAYVRKHKLQVLNEEAFLGIHLAEPDEADLQLVQDYVVYHGVQPAGQILIMQSKDVELIVALISHFAIINSDDNVSFSALQALVQLNDADLLYNVLSKYCKEQNEMHYANPQNVWPICFEEAVRMKNVKMLDVFSKLRFLSGIHFTAGHERFLFKEGSDEMISYYLGYWQLLNETLEDLTNGRLEYDKWEEVLKTEIARRELPVPVLLNLVKLDKRELLKEHYKKHGLNPKVLAFYANQQKFKEDVGL